MTLPVVCETPGCPNQGQDFNRISEIPLSDLDLFYEAWDGSDTNDFCPLCGKLGILQDPEFDENFDKELLAKEITR